MLFQRLRDWLARRPAIDKPELSAQQQRSAMMPDSSIAAPNTNQTLQVQLKLQYRQMAQGSKPLPSFDDVQFRAYSQNGEDGILLYVFALIGATNKRCIEVCAGEGIQCNTANLIINHGWSGLLLDGDEAKIKDGKAFYHSCRDTYVFPPKLISTWIDPDNINDIIRYHNFAGPIDLLSLDMDGIDYWIWKAIEVTEPRVVILEYQSAWGPERRVTLRHMENFRCEDVKAPAGLPRGGASLGAFVALAREKGYRLVGCERLCFNAIFIKNGVGEEYFPEVSTNTCFDNPLVDLRRMLMVEHEDMLPDIFEEV